MKKERNSYEAKPPELQGKESMDDLKKKKNSLNPPPPPSPPSPSYRARFTQVLTKVATPYLRSSLVFNSVALLTSILRGKRKRGHRISQQARAPSRQEAPNAKRPNREPFLDLLLLLVAGQTNLST